jgi:hypothetical protein
VKALQSKPAAESTLGGLAEFIQDSIAPLLVADQFLQDYLALPKIKEADCIRAKADATDSRSWELLKKLGEICNETKESNGMQSAIPFRLDLSPQTPQPNAKRESPSSSSSASSSSSSSSLSKFETDFQKYCFNQELPDARLDSVNFKIHCTMPMCGKSFNGGSATKFMFTNYKIHCEREHSGTLIAPFRYFPNCNYIY